MNNSLMLHCGATTATREEVYNAPIPASTQTWHPMGYRHMIDYLDHQVSQVLNMKVVKEQYGLTKEGNRMFGVWTLDTGSKEHGLAIAFRNSYDKSMASALAAGARVFCCDNLAISGDLFRVLRKNTLNCKRDFETLSDGLVSKVQMTYGDLTKEFETWKGVQVTQDQGYQLIGLAACHGLLKPTQFTKASAQWKNPDQADYLPRNLWSLYNAGTEALKKGDMRHMMSRLIDWHTFTRRTLADTTLPLVGTPLGQIWQGWATTKNPAPDTPVIVDLRQPQVDAPIVDLAEPAIVAPAQADDTSERFRRLELD